MEKHLEEHKSELKKSFYYFSPKTDCFQKVLLESGITEKIIDILNKNKARYLIVTKGDLSTYPHIFKKITKAKDRVQILVSYGMPDEKTRLILEPQALSLKKRLAFAKKCKLAGLQVVGILEPLLPLDDIKYVFKIMDKFKKIGIDHFAIDFMRISNYTLQKIKTQLPELFVKIESTFNTSDTKKETFRTGPLKERMVVRFAPSEKYLREKFDDIKKYATSINATVSVCNVFNLQNFNKEAGHRGYVCMGIQTKNN